MSARAIDLRRLDAWDQRWTEEERLDLLQQIAAIADELAELVPAKFCGEADEFIDRIYRRVGILSSPGEDRLRNLALGVSA